VSCRLVSFLMKVEGNYIRLVICRMLQTGLYSIAIRMNFKYDECQTRKRFFRCQVI
jgi:hypothetical protein